MVSVIMITYGHEKYIKEAINSVLSQQCNFDVELIIANDASPDESNYIIEKCLEENNSKISIKYLYRDTNMGMVSNLLDAVQKGTGKYMAMCEGDDYWTDVYKLQKQVDFLESNLDFSFCTHRYLIYSEFANKFSEQTQPSKFEPYNNLLDGVVITKNVFHKHWMTQPLTALIRMEQWLEVAKLHTEFKYFRDYHFFYLLLNKNKGLCMRFVGGVYRMHETGIYAGVNDIGRMKLAFSINDELYKHSKDKDFFQAYWNAALILLKRRKHTNYVLKSFLKNLTFNEKILALQALLFFVKKFLLKRKIK